MFRRKKDTGSTASPREAATKGKGGITIVFAAGNKPVPRQQLPPLLQLRLDCQMMIASYLPPLDLLRLSETCTALRQVCVTDELWKPLLALDFQVHSVGDGLALPTYLAQIKPYRYEAELTKLPAPGLCRAYWGAHYVDLQHQSLSELPRKLVLLPNIVELTLDNNHLGDLRSELAVHQAMLKLSLMYNQMQELPDVFTQLPGLQVLDLTGNQLTGDLHPLIGKLTGLKKLVLSQNQLTSLPRQIGHLQALEELIIDNNKLTEIPAEIGYLGRLRKLVCSSNQLAQVPATLGHCRELEELMLGSNQLKELPMELHPLTKVRSLVLHYNKFEVLPLVAYRMKSLVTLDLNHNELLSCPSGISALDELQYLYLGGNANLGNLPEDLHMLQLRNKVVTIKAKPAAAAAPAGEAPPVAPAAPAPPPA